MTTTSMAGSASIAANSTAAMPYRSATARALAIPRDEQEISCNCGHA
nr:hypothetical protein [Novosphingobium sp. PASSN1]